MIKIIKKGEPLDDGKVEVYEATCPSCGTVFEFTLKECSLEKRLDGNAFIDCPVCRNRLVRKRADLTTKYRINKEDD